MFFFVLSSSQCFKPFLTGNLDFPKIKKLKNVCSDAGIFRNVKTMQFGAKMYSKTIYVWLNIACFCHIYLGGYLEFLQKSF